MSNILNAKFDSDDEDEDYIPGEGNHHFFNSFTIHCRQRQKESKAY
jgi:hypothetical protein